MTRVGRTYVKGTAAGAANDGYFGNGSDGALNVAAGQTFTIDVPSEDTQIIKNYSSVNIAAGATVKTSGRCNGVVWLVNGDFILDGTIDMDKRAPLLNDNEAAAAQEPHVALCGALNGGKGGDAGVGGSVSGNNDYSYGTWTPFSYAPGVGGNGFRFGGGYGGGSSNAQGRGGSCEPRPPIGTAIPYPAGVKVSYCGTGATADGDDDGIGYGGKGPGGSAGLYLYYSSGVVYNGRDGDAVGGGAIWIFVKGKVRISSTGRITACGGNGGAGQCRTKGGEGGALGSSTQATGGGGAGGGGIVCLVHSGDCNVLGSVVANGGIGGTRGIGSLSTVQATNGEDGGIGTVLIKSIAELLDL